MANSMNIRYGVDWSANASPTSHCWFPLTSNESTLVRCGSCALEIDSSKIDNSIASCRPSFIDTNENDEHCWSQIYSLASPCARCQRTLNDNNNLFTSAYIPFERITTMINPKMSHGPCDGLVCLWCGRNYHQTCWQELTDDEKKVKCDYGIFQ